MKLKTKRKLRRVFSLYNLVIIACVIISVVSIIMFIKPDFTSWFATKYKEVDGVRIIQTGMKEDENIDENQARRVGVKQFKELGEDIKESDLTVQKIIRGGQELYYIRSAKNTMEICIKGGVVKRINSVIVE